MVLVAQLEQQLRLVSDICKFFLEFEMDRVSLVLSDNYIFK